MIKYLHIAFIICCFSNADNLTGQGIVDFNKLEERTLKENDTLYVVNFWATWCKPCIAELPVFKKADKHFENDKVKIILISLDFQSELDRVKTFVRNKEIEMEYLLLSDSNPNVWINKIDPSWSGAIPATVFYKHKNKLYFHEGDFTFETLKNSILNHLNK